MCNLCKDENFGMPRRDFIKTVGTSMAGISLVAGQVFDSSAAGVGKDERKIATIRGAFLYPPTKVLDEEGYYSWPGADFDAEGRQKQYLSRIRELESKLGIHIGMDRKSLFSDVDVDHFIADIKATKPDGLLLIPFKKAPSGDQIVRIIEETRIPSVVLAPLGILLVGHIKKLADMKGVYMINSTDNFEAVENGLRMIEARVWLKNASIINIGETKVIPLGVPVLGTRIRTVPHQRFYDYFADLKVNKEVEALGNRYMSEAVKIVQPTRDDIMDAAKSYFILKKILTEEKGDALMMDCLPGLKSPHKHVPPCMGFMSLRDEGTAVGCESDLDATLTMMLLQKLFGKPGFQHNPSWDTENNQYFCAHCTSASRMDGMEKPAEPYELMSHCESGWGTVPRVLFRKDQEITVAKFLSGKKPQFILYSGKTIGCPSIPPTGGCRTNLTATINELERGIDLKGHHLIMIYGNYVKQLRQFCRLFDIEVVV